MAGQLRYFRYALVLSAVLYGCSSFQHSYGTGAAGVVGKMLGVATVGVGIGGRQVEREMKYDDTVRAWVDRSGSPDFIRVVSQSEVEFIYLATDEFVTFSREKGSTSKAAVESPIPTAALQLAAIPSCEEEAAIKPYYGVGWDCEGAGNVDQQTQCQGFYLWKATTNCLDAARGKQAAARDKVAKLRTALPGDLDAYERKLNEAAAIRERELNEAAAIRECESAREESPCQELIDFLASPPIVARAEAAIRRLRAEIEEHTVEVTITAPSKRLLEIELVEALSSVSRCLLVRSPKDAATTQNIPRYDLIIDVLEYEARETPPSTVTRSIPRHEVNLLTAVLLMPDNSSYVYEEVTSGAQLRFAFELELKRRGGPEIDRMILRDTYTSYSRECSGSRVQNVFGGAQAVNFTANGAMQERCTGIHGKSIEELERELFRKIVSTVNGFTPIAEAISFR